MPLNTDEIMKLLRNLAKEEKLKVTLKHCVRAGAIIGGVSALSGLLLGPFGLALGALTSGTITSLVEKNKFSSVIDIISELPSEKQEALAENVRNIVRGLNVTDAVLLASLLSGNHTLRRQIVNELLNFVNNEVRMAAIGH